MAEYNKQNCKIPTCVIGHNFPSSCTQSPNLTAKPKWRRKKIEIPWRQPSLEWLPLRRPEETSHRVIKSINYFPLLRFDYALCFYVGNESHIPLGGLKANVTFEGVLLLCKIFPSFYWFSEDVNRENLMESKSVNHHTINCTIICTDMHKSHTPCSRFWWDRWNAPRYSLRLLLNNI